MVTKEQCDYLLPRAFNAALRAGAAILDVYDKGRDYEITIKEDLTPLTEADSRSHNIIKNYLGRTRVPILSEEGRAMLFQERMGWDLFWMVDPLDGTKEFIKGNGEFTVNIALMADNQPVLGIVYVPYIGRMYFADSERGSFLRENTYPEEDAEYSLEEMMAEARQLPLTTAANNPVRVAVSRSHNTEDTYALLDKLREKFPDMEVIEQGSSYKFCMLAEGTVDYYVRTTPTMEWDTAAGQVILETTGGTVRTIPNGTPIKYNDETLINPGFACRSRFMPEEA
ncbi:3'(2'),5'-bisphosphate nucleotidase CysQ [Alistipes sp. OttesenSCG-928-B03]|nr:3'(2'),5'-bisphosphate nucleotidase CysQ [Alistipes sp. OttesenSCG-928-B03]